MKRYIFLILLTSVLVAHSSETKSTKTFGEIIRGLEKQSELGDPDASGILGDLSSDGFIDTYIKYDRDKIILLIQRSYDKSSPFGQYSYGSAIQKGRFGFEKNEVEGKKIVSSAIAPLKDLAKNNNSFACLALYYIYRSNQSNEGEDSAEAFKWLKNGSALNNTICHYYLFMEVLLSDDIEQEEVDLALNTLLTIKQNPYFYGIPKSKLDELYAWIINLKFNELKFDLVSAQSFDKSVVSHFRNQRYHCDLILTFFPTKSGKLSNSADIKIFLNTDPEKNFKEYSCMFKMTTRLLIALNDCRQKFSEWTKKANELYPPAFEKCLNADRDDIQNGIIVNFEWDGIGQSRARFGIGESYDEKTVLLLTHVFRSVYSTENEPLSFRMRTIDCIESIQKAQSKVDTQIDENFN